MNFKLEKKRKKTFSVLANVDTICVLKISLWTSAQR